MKQVKTIYNYNVSVDGEFVIRTDLEFANELRVAFLAQNRNVIVEQI